MIVSETVEEVSEEEISEEEIDEKSITSKSGRPKFHVHTKPLQKEQDMPYKKRKQKCTQSDGDKGNYVLSYTTKKGEKRKACHTSEKNMQGQIAAIEAESDETYGEEINEDIARILIKDFTRSMISEAALTKKAVFKYNHRVQTFIDKMQNGGDFVLNSDKVTRIQIPQTASGYNNDKLYNALLNNDQEGYKNAFSRPHILAKSGGQDIVITAMNQLWKGDSKTYPDFGGGGSKAQDVGTQYEVDAAEYFKSVLQNNLEVELKGGSAGASDIGSDNEYYIGSDRDNLSPNTNILKVEVKTSAGATFGQMQWGFTIDENGLPLEFKFRGKKKAQEPINKPIAEFLNDSSRLNDLRRRVASISSSIPDWQENYKISSIEGEELVTGFLGGEGGRNAATEMVYKYMTRGFAEIEKSAADIIPNVGYEYYKSKGDQFIIIGKLGSKPGGIYSLDAPETEPLAKALGIPSFSGAGTTNIGLRTGGARLIHAPTLRFNTDIKPAPFPKDLEALKIAVARPAGQLGQIAVGFSLFIQGSLDGLGSSAIVTAINDAIAILNSNNEEQIEAILDSSPLTKDDIEGNLDQEDNIDMQDAKMIVGDILSESREVFENKELSLIVEELTGSDRTEIKRMISKEIDGAANKKMTQKIFQAEFNRELKKALGTSFIGEPGKINKFVKEAIQKEIDSTFKDKATQNQIGEITKAVIKKLYRELSYSSVHIVDRIKL